MTAKPFSRRQSRRPIPRRSRRPCLEALEERRLLAGSVPSGTYVEDFQLNSDPTERGFDVGGALEERITYVSGTIGVNHVITDPNELQGPEGTWHLGQAPG